MRRSSTKFLPNSEDSVRAARTTLLVTVISRSDSTAGFQPRTQPLLRVKKYQTSLKRACLMKLRINVTSKKRTEAVMAQSFNDQKLNPELACNSTCSSLTFVI